MLEEIDVSNKKCQKGVRIAKHEERLNRIQDQTGYVVGLVDAMRVEENPQCYEIKYRERTQLRTHKIYMN